MRRGQHLAGAVAALAAAALAGCGFGSGERTSGTATLTVTRDYGANRMLEAGVADPAETDTVIRVLDREAAIQTRYGGGFVQSIEGLAGGSEAGRRFDWFFYVNGIESPVGSADVPVRAGDRIWWDHHDWTDVMRVPAVVGSWPEPFVQAAGREAVPVLVQCAQAAGPCERTHAALADAGARPERAPLQGRRGDAMRVLVGPYAALRHDPAAALLAQEPAASGVFARAERVPSGWRFSLLDSRAEPAARLAPEHGIVAAVRVGERPPTWLVTGATGAGVAAAAGMLGAEHLGGRFAVAGSAAEPRALPLEGGA